MNITDITLKWSEIDTSAISDLEGLSSNDITDVFRLVESGRVALRNHNANRDNERCNFETVLNEIEFLAHKLWGSDSKKVVLTRELLALYKLGGKYEWETELLNRLITKGCC